MGAYDKTKSTETYLEDLTQRWWQRREGDGGGGQQTNRQSGKQSDIQTYEYGESNTLKNSKEGRQNIDRITERQTDRLTDKQTESRQIGGRQT